MWSVKKDTRPKLRQLLTVRQNSFTSRLSSDHVTNWSLKITPTHLKRVSTLPCENLSVQKIDLIVRYKLTNRFIGFFRRLMKRQTDSSSCGLVEFLALNITYYQISLAMTVLPRRGIVFHRRRINAKEPSGINWNQSQAAWRQQQ